MTEAMEVVCDVSKPNIVYMDLRNSQKIIVSKNFLKNMTVMLLSKDH